MQRVWVDEGARVTRISKNRVVVDGSVCRWCGVVLVVVVAVVVAHGVILISED